MLPHTLLFRGLSDQRMFTEIQVSMCYYELFIYLAGMIFTPQNAVKRTIPFIYFVSQLIRSESPHTRLAGNKNF